MKLSFTKSKTYLIVAEVVARTLPTWYGTADSLVVLCVQSKIKRKAIENLNHIKSYFINSCHCNSLSFSSVSSARESKKEASLKQNLLDPNKNTFEAHNVL